MFQLHHVHGHQDEKMCFAQLDIPSQANVRMDKKVGKYISKMHETPTSSQAPILPSQSIYLTNGTEIITSAIREHLIDTFNLDQRQQYLHKHLNITKESYNHIEWNGIARYLRRNKTTRGKIVKTINAEWHTMKIAHRWNNNETELCPLCSKCEETCNHILCCPNLHMTRVREKYTRNLENQLKNLHTHPDIQTSIMTGIKSITSTNIPPDIPPSTSTQQSTIQQAYQQQETIGWHNMLRGYISKKWISIQDEHYDRNNFGKKFNISRWINKIIEATILIARKLWRERCEIVNTSNTYTLEQRTRDMAFDLCRELRPTAWKLYKEDQHLIRKQQSFFQTARFDQIQSWEQAIAKAMKNGQQRMDRSCGKLTKWIQRTPSRNISHTTSIMAISSNENTLPIIQCRVQHPLKPKQPNQTFFDETYHKRKNIPPDPNQPHRIWNKNYAKGRERIFQKFSKYGRKQRRNYNSPQPHHQNSISSEKGRQLNISTFTSPLLTLNLSYN